MDYRLHLAKRMLVNKRGSLIGAVLAVAIGILVINVNFAKILNNNKNSISQPSFLKTKIIDGEVKWTPSQGQFFL